MELSVAPVLWKWRDDTAWKDYDKATCKILEEAYQKGIKKIDLSHGWFLDKGYLVHLKKMAQYNPKTNGYRHVQRVDPSKPICWYWQTEEEWKAYDLPTSQQIEDAYQKNIRTIQLSEGFFADKRYSVILKNAPFVQENAATGVIRPVRRNVGSPMKKKNVVKLVVNFTPSSGVFGSHSSTETVLEMTLGEGWCWSKGHTWKAFDEETTREIELAYSNLSLSYVSLSTGAFGTQPGAYIIDLNRMVQANLHTGMVRTVQRLGYQVDPREMGLKLIDTTYVLPAGLEWKTPMSQSKPKTKKRAGPPRATLPSTTLSMSPPRSPPRDQGSPRSPPRDRSSPERWLSPQREKKIPNVLPFRVTTRLSFETSHCGAPRGSTNQVSKNFG